MPKRSSTTGNTIEKFTGKERDEAIGLDYFGARYYDAALVRWLSVDPLAKEYPEWSPYNYTLNNPINLIDPDGRQTCEDEGECRKIVQTINVTQTTNIEGRKQTRRIQVSINYAPTDDGVSSNQKVKNEIADAVETTIAEAALKADITSVTITSTTNGDHSDESNHYDSEAVDIGAINGVSVQEHGDSEQVKALQNSFENRSNTNENFGPNQMTKRSGPYIHDKLSADEKKKNIAVKRGHEDHLHFSVDTY